MTDIPAIARGLTPAMTDPTQEQVEAATLNIWHKLGQIEENVRAGQLTMEEVRVLATAAIAALRPWMREGEPVAWMYERDNSRYIER